MQYKLVNSLVVYYVIATIIQYIYCLKWLSYHSKHVTGRRFSGVTSSLFPVSALLDWPNEQQHRPRPQKRPPQLRVARARARTDGRSSSWYHPTKPFSLYDDERTTLDVVVGRLAGGRRRRPSLQLLFRRRHESRLLVKFAGVPGEPRLFHGQEAHRVSVADRRPRSSHDQTSHGLFPCVAMP